MSPKKKIEDLLNQLTEDNQQETLDEIEKFCENPANTQAREHLLNLVMGFGDQDYLGSTKLGSGTGVILGGFRGEVLGSMDMTRGAVDKDRIEELMSKNTEDFCYILEKSGGINEFMEKHPEPLRPTPFDK